MNMIYFQKLFVKLFRIIYQIIIFYKKRIKRCFNELNLILKNIKKQIFGDSSF